jgi:hypothetical protein
MVNSWLESHTVELVSDSTDKFLSQHTIDIEDLWNHLLQFMIILVDLLKIGIVITNYLTEFLLGWMSKFCKLLFKPTLYVIDDGVDGTMAFIDFLL